MRPQHTASCAPEPGLVMSLIQAPLIVRGIPRTPSSRQMISVRVGSGVYHAACLLPSHTSTSRGCAPGASIVVDWWLEMAEMTDEEISQNLQVVSITVNFGVDDVRRLRPDWSVEECEHLIDSLYRELAEEAKEAGTAFILRVIQKIEEEQRGAQN